MLFQSVKDREARVLRVNVFAIVVKQQPRRGVATVALILFNVLGQAVAEGLHLLSQPVPKSRETRRQCMVICVCLSSSNLILTPNTPFG